MIGHTTTTPLNCPLEEKNTELSTILNVYFNNTEIVFTVTGLDDIILFI